MACHGTFKAGCSNLAAVSPLTPLNIQLSCSVTFEHPDLSRSLTTDNLAVLHVGWNTNPRKHKQRCLEMQLPVRPGGFEVFCGTAGNFPKVIFRQPLHWLYTPKEIHGWAEIRPCSVWSEEITSAALRIRHYNANRKRPDPLWSGPLRHWTEPGTPVLTFLFHQDPEWFFGERFRPCFSKMVDGRLKERGGIDNKATKNINWSQWEMTKHITILLILFTHPSVLYYAVVVASLVLRISLPSMTLCCTVHLTNKTLWRSIYKTPNYHNNNLVFGFDD